MESEAQWLIEEKREKEKKRPSCFFHLTCWLFWERIHLLACSHAFIWTWCVHQIAAEKNPWHDKQSKSKKESAREARLPLSLAVFQLRSSPMICLWLTTPLCLSSLFKVKGQPVSQWACMQMTSFQWRVEVAVVVVVVALVVVLVAEKRRSIHNHYLLLQLYVERERKKN